MDVNIPYHKTSSIKRSPGSIKIVDRSYVVGASSVGAAPTTSSFSMDWAKRTGGRDEKKLTLEIRCNLSKMLDGTYFAMFLHHHQQGHTDSHQPICYEWTHWLMRQSTMSNNICLLYESQNQIKTVGKYDACNHNLVLVVWCAFFFQSLVAIDRWLSASMYFDCSDNLWKNIESLITTNFEFGLHK